MNAMKLLLSTTSIGVALSLSLPVHAKIATNKIATNKIATNKITTNKITTNKKVTASRIAIAAEPLWTTAGDGAFSTVDAIVLPDGKRLSR